MLYRTWATSPRGIDPQGFNRLSMGVQDLTPEVQKAITRDQTFEQTLGLAEDGNRQP